MVSGLKIMQVALVFVSLPFESDMVVGCCPPAEFREVEKPFHEIPDEERQIEQLALLGGMDALMIYFLCRELPTGKDHSEERYGIISTTEEMSVYDYNLCHC